MERCPTGAVVLQNGHPTFIHPELRAYCGLCEELCPEGAIAPSFEIGGPGESWPSSFGGEIQR